MDELALITAGPSARGIATPTGAPVVCVNMAGAIHKPDWLAFHDERCLLASMVPNEGFITSHGCMTEHWQPKQVTMYGMDMGSGTGDCAGHVSGSRTIERWRLEIRQLAKIWSPAIELHQSCSISDRLGESLFNAGRQNGSWHDH